MADFDVVVIGAGPGGYVAAIKAAQLGLKVACIEKRGALGGTCLNVGCIPSKALLQSSHKYYDAKHHFKEHGIEAEVKLSLSKMMSRKESVVAALNKGIEGLFAKNKVEYIKGEASFVSKGELKVGSKKITAKNIIIATGSDVSSLPGIKIDEKYIVSSTGALSLSNVPKKMLVIGGGVIGLELGSVWSRLGAEVTVVEYSDRLVPAMDLDISKELLKILQAQGMKFQLNTKVVYASVKNSKVEVATEGVDESKEKGNATYDIVLVAVGRRPYTENLNLSVLGISQNKMGCIEVDKNYRTACEGVYAIGDVIAGPMLAHKAEEEGVAVAEIIAGQHGHVNYATIPGVIYTHPEVASVGLTEKEVREQGIEYSIGKFPFLANSRARANGDTEGFVKIIADKKSDRVLGVHIIGAIAGDLIAEVVTAMEFKAASEDIARICHAHPSMSEAVKEAALAAHFKPIHM